MMVIYFNAPVHPLSESRYGPNGTPTAVHSFVATPCNRFTIPRRCALLCTAVDPPFSPSNRGF
jgi:hypothetical protein